MYLYNLNFYQNKNLVVECFMQCDADNAKEAMKIFKVRVSPRNYHGRDFAELKRDYPGLTMKAEKSIYN